MPGSFITFIVFAVIFLIVMTIAVVAWRVSKDSQEPFPGIGVIGLGTVLGIIVLIPLIAGSYTVVPTRSIGVVTTFGKPTGEQLSNGFHLKAPWTKVQELDGAVQIERNTGDNSYEARLGNSSKAQVENTVQWRLKPSAADKLFLDYKTFDRINKNLVERQTQSAINDVMATYNPIDSTSTANKGSNDELAAKVLNLLRQRAGNEIDFMSVTIPLIQFDQGTQQKLDQINQQLAATTIAEEQKKTNAAQAEANRILAASVDNSQGVLTAQCLNVAREKNLNLICFPLGNAQATVPVR